MPFDVNFVVNQFFAIGHSHDSIYGRGQSYTPASTIRINHFSIIGKRSWNRNKASAFCNKITTLDWDIRSGAQDGAVLASGSFNFQQQTAWKIDRTIKYTITLSSPIILTGSTQYFFTIYMADDEVDAMFPFFWAENPTTDGSESTWAWRASSVVGNTSSYTLWLEISDQQAGAKWHLTIDGCGYMQPKSMLGWRSDQVSSGLAQSRGGMAEYSQLLYPYSNFSQDDWTSGGGQLDMLDPHAYAYGENIDTTIPGQIILGPRPIWAGEAQDGEEYDSQRTAGRGVPDLSVAEYTLAGGDFIFAQRFQASATYTATLVGIKGRCIGWLSGVNFYVSIWSDTTGSPNANLTGWQHITLGKKGYKWVNATVSQALTSGTYYWVAVKSLQGSVPHIIENRVLFDQDGSAPAGAAKYSDDGASSWNTYTGYSLLFRINNGGTTGELDGNITKFAYGEANSVAYFVCTAGKKVYKWDETNQEWDDLSTGIKGDGNNETSENIQCIEFFNDSLHVGTGTFGSADKILSWDGTAEDYTAWSEHATQKARRFRVGKGYLWTACAYNEVKYSSDASTWSSSIVVGEDLWYITDMIAYAGLFLVGKENGIWRINQPDDIAEQYTLFPGIEHFWNCYGWAVWNGMLYIPLQRTNVWRWMGSSYKEIGPFDNKTGWDSKWEVEIGDFHPTPGKLWAGMSCSTASKYGGLFAFNGMGWHPMVTHELTNKVNQDVYVTTKVGSETRVWFTMAKRTYYISLPTSGQNPYEWSSAEYNPNFGLLATSWWDGGVKDAFKFWNRLTLIADMPDDTEIEVFFAKDGEDWESTSDVYALGTLNNNLLTEEGEYVLMFPDGMIAKSIQLIFVLRTYNYDVTPRIRAYNIEAVVRQIPVDVYSFQVELADNITRLDGTDATRTADDMWTELQLARTKNFPVLVSFPNTTVRGFITNLSQHTVDYAPRGPDDIRWDRVAVVSVVEAL